MHFVKEFDDQGRFAPLFAFLWYVRLGHQVGLSYGLLIYIIGLLVRTTYCCCGGKYARGSQETALPTTWRTANLASTHVCALTDIKLLGFSIGHSPYSLDSARFALLDMSPDFFAGRAIITGSWVFAGQTAVSTGRSLIVNLPKVAI